MFPKDLGKKKSIMSELLSIPVRNVVIIKISNAKLRM